MVKVVNDSAAIEIADLRIRYEGTTEFAVDGVSCSVGAGELVSLVGESGSGKTTIARSLFGLLPSNAEASCTRLAIGGAQAPRRGIDAAFLRRARVALVPQDPAVSLDPVKSIESHFRELFRLDSRGLERRIVRERAARLLESVGIDNPAVRLQQYSHELSGGQNQRVLIALALAREPRVLVADEPTSGLDVTVQRQVLDVIDELRRSRRLSVLLITHDLVLAAERSDRIIVLERGRIADHGDPRQVFFSSASDYTRRLVTSTPEQLPARPTSAVTEVLLRGEDLVKRFTVRDAQGRRQALHAVDEVAVEVRAGQTTALVGESGSGKSTTARLLVGLERADSGQITYRDVFQPFQRRRTRRAALREIQFVYQNPYSSLNPALSVERIIIEPLQALGIGTEASRRARARELIEAVRLDPAVLARRPRALSGGQLQRVAIARALSSEPSVLVLDEPVSALDVSVQFTVLALLAQLQREYGLSYLLISHDLAVVRATADHVAVMRAGRILEHGPTETIFTDPRHDYTRSLIGARPRIPWRANDPSSSITDSGKGTIE